MIPTAHVTSGVDRADQERHAVVRSAMDLLRKDYPWPREMVHRHVVNILLDSCIKQERWSRGAA